MRRRGPGWKKSLQCNSHGHTWPTQSRIRVMAIVADRPERSTSLSGRDHVPSRAALPLWDFHASYMNTCSPRVPESLAWYQLYLDLRLIFCSFSLSHSLFVQSYRLLLADLDVLLQLNHLLPGKSNFIGDLRSTHSLPFPLSNQRRRLS